MEVMVFPGLPSQDCVRIKAEHEWTGLCAPRVLRTSWLFLLLVGERSCWGWVGPEDPFLVGITLPPPLLEHQALPAHLSPSPSPPCLPFSAVLGTAWYYRYKRSSSPGLHLLMLSNKGPKEVHSPHFWGACTSSLVPTPQGSAFGSRTCPALPKGPGPLCTSPLL